MTRLLQSADRMINMQLCGVWFIKTDAAFLI